MTPDIETEIRAHAVADYPREACGVIVVAKGRERYIACRNIADTPDEHFVLSPEDYADAEELGEIVAIVHSHPDGAAQPSEADRVQCEVSGLPWHIVAVSVEGAGELVAFAPCGFHAPLVGRQFAHGVNDCYTLCRDYYAREHQILLPDFERRDEWWHRGLDLYMDHFAEVGFAPIVGAPKAGDAILMQVRAPVANHAAVYLGDGLILHHLHGRLSSRDVYAGMYQEITRMILRHKDMP